MQAPVQPAQQPVPPQPMGWMTPEERTQVTAQLRTYRLATDFPAGAAGAAGDMVLRFMPDFIVTAVQEMRNPIMRAEYPDIANRYKFISEVLFAGVYKKDPGVKKAVLALTSIMA